MKTNNKLVISKICKNIVKQFITIALLNKKLYLIKAKLYISSDFENVKYIIYLFIFIIIIICKQKWG